LGNKISLPRSNRRNTNPLPPTSATNQRHQQHSNTQKGIGYAAFSSGNITEEIINQYLDHHKEQPNSDDNFILEK
jgi:hypothetical protein